MQRETRLVGWFALVLGGVAFVSGLSILAGGYAPASGSGCKAVCGLAMLVTEIFGETAGGLAAGSLWLAVGSVVSWFGFRVLKDSAV